MKLHRVWWPALPAGILALSSAAQEQISDDVVGIGLLADQSGPYALLRLRMPRQTTLRNTRAGSHAC